MGSKTLDYKLIKLLFALGSFSVKILKAFVNIRTSSFVFHKVPSVFNESDIFSGSVVGASVGALSRRGEASIIFESLRLILSIEIPL